MFILKKTLYSQKKWNKRLVKYNQKGYTINSINRAFIVMSKKNGTQNYFNVTSLSQLEEPHILASSESFTAYISDCECDQDNIALGKYYDWLITRHNSTTFKILIPIVFLVIFYDFMPNYLKSISTSIIIVIFLIAFLRNLSRKLFINKVVKPHNLKNNLNSELLSKVYIVKSLSPLNSETINLISECGKILKIKSKDGYHNYKLDSVLERTEIIDITKNTSQKLEVFSTVTN